MGKFIPERVIEEIKFRNDIVEVIGSYVTLKRMGSAYKACCPFHKEKTPSFNVTPSMQIFKCFGCGESGNVISFVMKHQGLDFVSAAKLLADRVGISLDLEDDGGASKHRKLLFEINHEIAQFYQRCLKQAPGAAAARKYIEERKLDSSTADDFMIGYAPDGWDITLQWGDKHKYTADQLEEAGLVLRSENKNSRGRFYSRFRNRLMFPILDSQGRVIGFSARILINDKKAPKYVNSPETALFHKSRVLYGLDKARRHIVNADNREAVICEGQIDVIRCHQAGINTAIAAQGTAFTPDHAKALKNYADSIVLAFDSDAAGRKAAVKTAIIFMDAGIVAGIAELPAGEDPDSYILANGSKAFRKLLDEAQSVISFQIRAMSAEESDANGAAATGRIANAVLQSISHSTNAVQKARLLQEAAKLLNLPEKALEEDLLKIEEEQKRAEERRARMPQNQPAQTNQTDSIPPGYYEEEPPTEDLDPHDLYDGEFSKQDSMQGGGAPQPAIPQISDEEQLLCEHVVHIVDYPELAELIREYLPLEMVSSPMCRQLISFALDAAKNNNDLVEELLAEGDSAAVVLEYAEKLISTPVKVTGREYSPAEAVQDIILSMWRSRLGAERRRIMAKGNMRTPDEAARRSQITVDLKHMRRWESGHDIIVIERAMMNES
jgi:DNA primase